MLEDFVIDDGGHLLFGVALMFALFAMFALFTRNVAAAKYIDLLFTFITIILLLLHNAYTFLLIAMRLPGRQANCHRVLLGHGSVCFTRVQQF